MKCDDYYLTTHFTDEGPSVGMGRDVSVQFSSRSPLLLAEFTLIFGLLDRWQPDLLDTLIAGFARTSNDLLTQAKVNK